jgi:O-antigen ligase
MVAVASCVALVAVLEALQVEPVMAALTVFRPGFHVVAGQLRATSTLFYPTIASMYLEVAFVMGLWLLLDHPARRRPIDRAIAFGALALIGAGIIATFTRAGLLAMMAALSLLAVLRLARVPRERAGLGVLTSLALTLIAVTLVAHSPELLAARLTTEGSDAWYGARYDVPKSVALQTGGVHRIPITLTNTGRLSWNSSSEPPFAVSYHWLRDTAVVEFEGQRTRFATPVQPGQTATMHADIIAPGEPGTYTLVWDLVHETRAWFSSEGVEVARTQVVVTGEPTAPVAVRMQQLPTATIRPPRPELWRAALKMASAHPWVGVGPDNYRLVYGAYVGARRADPSVHANNMYLEVLAGSGVPGLAALLALVATAGTTLWRRLRSATEETHIATAVALALWVVIAGHGLVDSFLSFTTTYVTFAIAGGWAVSRGLIDGAGNAHRV